MKTLSVKQPWAYLICAGIKDVENRTWKTKFKGRVLIHASGKPLANGKCISHFLTDDQYRFVAFTTPTNQQLDTCFLDHCNSAIIGSVEIVDCVVNCTSVWAKKSIDCKDGCQDVENCPVGKCPHLIYNWVLANPILFDEPILNVKGKLGFWNYEINNK